MNKIKRKQYLLMLEQTIQTPEIKVITGIRRAGKSHLMESFIDEIREKNPNANIIHINFNNLETENLTEYHALNDFVLKKYIPEQENFLFIDEVQLCKGFEKAINSLHSSQKFHIYITGSNAFLLSSDLATLFTGRTFEIHVFPFSFSEYIEYFGSSNIYETFTEYAKFGGMAGSFVYQTEQQKFTYVNEVFKTLILRDIKQKYKIKNVPLLEKLKDFLLDNISSEISVRSIANTLNSTSEKTNNKTVSSYIEYLCNAFLFYKIRRYDIHGKKYLASQEKYYLSDHSFRYAALGTKNLDYGRIYENIVAIELLRRGYEVYTGILYKKEIDFVAVKQSEKIYIQVSDNISEQSTLQREISPLLSIKDAFPKIIIARTMHEEYSVEGVKIVDIASWLLDF